MNKKKEIFKAFNEDYLISNFGRWYSLKNNQFLKQQCNSSGYLRVKLNLESKYKWLFTHKIVVLMFGDCNGLKFQDKNSEKFCNYTIDHKDFNKLNNKFYNLELVTHQENCKRRSNYYKKCVKCKK